MNHATDAGGVVDDPLRCGECGGAVFRLSNTRCAEDHRAGGGGLVRDTAAALGTVVAGSVVVCCIGCDGETRIRASAPTLVFGSDGHLCGGWRTDREPRVDTESLADEVERIVHAFPTGDSRRADVRKLAERIRTVEAEAAVHGGEWCAENRAAGRGGCGLCGWCCKQATERAELAELKLRLMEDKS